jgi:hypothetical protein
MDVRSHLLQQAAIVGSLLWHSIHSELNLCFAELEAKEYVNETDLRIDVMKFVSHVKNKTQRQDLSSEELADGMRQRLTACDRIWQLVRGHDVIDILAFALRKTLGNWKAQESTREHIERGLRLAYAEDDFVQTHLCISIRAWETSHPAFRVFRNLRQQTLAL